MCIYAFLTRFEEGAVENFTGPFHMSFYLHLTDAARMLSSFPRVMRIIIKMVIITLYVHIWEGAVKIFKKEKKNLYRPAAHTTMWWRRRRAYRYSRRRSIISKMTCVKNGISRGLCYTREYVYRVRTYYKFIYIYIYTCRTDRNPHAHVIIYVHRRNAACSRIMRA